MIRKNKYITVALLLLGMTLMLGGFAFATAAQAENAEKAVIQQLISGQLDAIRERDADMAYALTTGSVHEKFTNAREFMTAVRFSHRALYDHQSFRFLDQTKTTDGGLLQRVEVSYAHGAPSLVIYRLERNPEGAWAISSFTVLDSTEGQDV
ncbi:MAG TPA: DUF4864 domain-containing protein [Micavibrio sp.]